MNRATPKPAAKLPSPSPQDVSQRPRERVEVASLMAGRRDVVLVHGVEEYLLRITSNGKLILTK